MLKGIKEFIVAGEICAVRRLCFSPKQFQLRSAPLLWYFLSLYSSSLCANFTCHLSSCIIFTVFLIWRGFKCIHCGRINSDTCRNMEVQEGLEGKCIFCGKRLEELPSVMVKRDLQTIKYASLEAQ